MTGFKEGYKQGYRTGIYVEVRRDGSIRLHSRELPPRRQYEIITHGNVLYFVKWGTKLDTLFKVLPRMELEESITNMIRITRDDLPREVQW